MKPMHEWMRDVSSMIRDEAEASTIAGQGQRLELLAREIDHWADVLLRAAPDAAHIMLLEIGERPPDALSWPTPNIAVVEALRAVERAAGDD